MFEFWLCHLAILENKQNNLNLFLSFLICIMTIMQPYSFQKAQIKMLVLAFLKLNQQTTDPSVVEELYSHWYYKVTDVFGLHTSKPVAVLVYIN